MALLTATPITTAGVVITGGATPTGGTGDTFANTGKEFVLVTNGSGAGITVTLDHKDSPDGAVVTDPTVSVAAGETRLIGPFPKGYYDNASGQVKFTCSATTSVTVKVFQLTAA